MSGCFHCGEPVPAGTDFSLLVRGARRAVCCPGCLAVATLIEHQGLGRFYDFRSAPSARPSERGTASPWSVCDRPEVAARLAPAVGPDRHELRCQVDGVTCAACVWLLERGVRGLDGVADVSVNPLSGETAVQFDPARARLSTILDTIASFGFEPRPAALGRRRAETSRAELKRLAVAGLGAAQVMTFAAALYVGAFKHMEGRLHAVLRAREHGRSPRPSCCMRARRSFAPRGSTCGGGASAWTCPWRSRSPSRCSRACGTRCAATVPCTSIRRRCSCSSCRSAASSSRAPATAPAACSPRSRICDRSRPRAGRAPTLTRVGTVELVPGDQVVVAPGETVPADGELMSEQASFDESLLSGESLGRLRRRGEPVLGGSLNAGRAPAEIRVTHVGADSYLERVGGLLHRALADRPEFLRLADRWATAFVGGLLAITIAAGSFWLAMAPARAFEIVLALLVVTCPCALSLAAPTAFAVALGRLARRGLLLRSARVLERLGDVTLWMFDKTGTLSEGRIVIAAGRCACGRGRRAVPRDRCRARGRQRASRSPAR